MLKYNADIKLAEVMNFYKHKICKPGKRRQKLKQERKSSGRRDFLRKSRKEAPATPNETEAQNKIAANVVTPTEQTETRPSIEKGRKL